MKGHLKFCLESKKKQMEERKKKEEKRDSSGLIPVGTRMGTKDEENLGVNSF